MAWFITIVFKVDAKYQASDNKTALERRVANSHWMKRFQEQQKKDARGIDLLSDDQILPDPDDLPEAECCEEKKKVVLVYHLDILTRLCELFNLTTADQLIDALYETGAHSDLIITC